MPFYGTYNVSVEEKAEEGKPARVGLLYGRTGVPLFLLFLRGATKVESLAIHSLDAIASQAIRASFPEDRSAWEALFPFFEAGGNLAQVLINPLSESSLSCAVIRGEDRGLRNRSGLCAVKGMAEVADIVAVPQAVLLPENEFVGFVQALCDTVTVHESFFALIDFPKHYSLGQAAELVRNTSCPGAAAYHPWLLKDGRAFAPSAAVAAGFQVNDQLRGIQEVPANQPLRGGYSPLFEAGPLQVREYLAARINTFVQLAKNEVRIWGGSTLADRLDFNAKYISIRRTSTALKEAIHRTCEPFVLDPAAENVAIFIETGIHNFLKSVKGVFNPDAPEPYSVKVTLEKAGADDMIQVNISYSLAHAVEQLNLSVGVQA